MLKVKTDQFFFSPNLFSPHSDSTVIGRFLTRCLKAQCNFLFGPPALPLALLCNLIQRPVEECDFQILKCVQAY